MSTACPLIVLPIRGLKSFQERRVTVNGWCKMIYTFCIKTVHLKMVLQFGSVSIGVVWAVRSEWRLV